MRPICWLHISDIHVSKRDEWSQDVALTAMCEHIAARRKEGIAPDFILATGDLAFSGKKEEYDIAAGFFDAISEASGVPRERIFCIAGNHDIDRDREKLSFLGARGHLQDQNRVDALLAPDDDMATLLKREEAFRSFLESNFKGQERTRTADGLAYVARLTIEDVRLAILGLDSAWLAEGGLGDHGKLLIGERQVINAIRLAREGGESPHVILAMSHHPFHLLNGFDRRPAQDWIEGACHFFHCGHLHEPEVRAAGLTGGGCLTLAAGASFETRLSHNTYSCVTLDLFRARRSVTTVQYNPGSRQFVAAAPVEYPAELGASEKCGVRQLADAIIAYNPDLCPLACYLAALLLDQKAELPVPGNAGYALGSFALMQGLPDSDLKRKTVDFMNFRNALRVLYRKGGLDDVFARHGDAVAQYGAALQEICGTDAALKARLADQENDARALAGTELSRPFAHADSLLSDLAAAGEWGLLREQAQRHMNLPNPESVLLAKRMLALALANADEAADKEAAVALYRELTASETADSGDLANLATLLCKFGRHDEAKETILAGMERFSQQAGRFAGIGQEIVAATGDRDFRKRVEEALAKRGQRD